MTLVIDKRDMAKARKSVSATVKALDVALMRAVNRVADSQRTAASKAIRDQVKLPAAYVNQNLKVTQRATRNRLEAVISGRKQPTRLARYGAKALPSRTGRPAGVSVHVHSRGGRKKMRKGFLLPLKDSGGYGVFVRTGPEGKRTRNARRDWSTVKHLYGPSVDQVFRGVREEARPQIRKALRSEFRRQLDYARSKES